MITLKVVHILYTVVIILSIAQLLRSLELNQRGVCLDEEGNYIISMDEKYQLDTLRHICCKGWTKTGYDTCEPTCELGCSNGNCVDANVCQCTPPLVLSEGRACVPPTCPHGYHNDPVACKPKCDEECVYGYCVSPNKCKCIGDFVRLNDTHCAPKCPAKYRNDPIECKPICETECVNATCVAPNKCKCLDNYIRANETHCGLKPTQNTINTTAVDNNPNTQCTAANTTNPNVANTLDILDNTRRLILDEINDVYKSKYAILSHYNEILFKLDQIQNNMLISNTVH